MSQARFYLRQAGGQALITLLAFVSMTMVMTAAATTVAITNLQATARFAQSEKAMSAAEMGADHAVLQLMRDPAYAPSAATPDIITVDSGTATITMSGTTTRTIISEGLNGSFRRRVQVTATVAATSIVTVTAWSYID